MTAQALVCFFAGISVFLLIVAFSFVRSSTNARTEVARWISRTTRGAQTLLKGKVWAIAVLSLLVPTFAYAQPEQGRRGGQPGAAGSDHR